jgi:leader peptidase (prepilin peptidase)/N-methyltransferase
MELAWAAAGLAAGTLIGAVLRGTVFRLSVPPGDPPRTTCPRCASPVPRWLPLRCRSCRSRLAVPLVLELATAAVLALLLGRFGGQPDMAAFCFLGALGVSLAAIDISVQRLPDALTLPAYPVLIILLALAALAGHQAGALVRALAGGAALAAAYLALGLLRPGQLGGGDIKSRAWPGSPWPGWAGRSCWPGPASGSCSPRWSAWDCWPRGGSPCAARSASGRSCSAVPCSRCSPSAERVGGAGPAGRVNLRRGLRVNVVQQCCGPRAGKSPGMAPCFEITGGVAVVTM